MAVIKGSKVTLQVEDPGNPGNYDIIAGSTDTSINLGGDEIDVTSADDIADGVTWRTFLSGMADLNLSGNFFIKDAATYQRIIGDRLGDTIRNYRADVDSYGLFAGPGRVTIANIEGPFSGAATYAVTIRAAGAWTHTPEVSAPVNTVLPAVCGVANEGDVLTAYTGVWTGGGIAFTYQWQADAAGNNTFANISGATAKTYTPVAGDVTDKLRVIVTATNAHSAVSATSAPTIAVTDV